VVALEVGRVCMKTAGREAGRYCVVLKKLDNTFVLVTGPKTLTGIKRRRCNIEHLEPTQHSLKIAAEATDTVVIKAYDAIGLTRKLSLRLPSPEVMKEVEKKVKEVPKKVEKPKIKKPEKPKKEEKPVKKEEKKPEKKEEKPKEKKGITIKFKIPSLRKKKPKEEKKVVKKPVKKPVKKRPAKKPKKTAKTVKKKKK